jgi:hypothetical protein
MRSILSALVFFNLNGWYRAQHLALAGQYLTVAARIGQPFS